MENISDKIIDNKNNEIIQKFTLKNSNKSYHFLISKTNNDKRIIISSGDYKIELSKKEIIKKTNIYLETIDEGYNLIINLFNSKKIIIKELLEGKVMKLSLKIFNYIKNQEDEVILCLKIDNNENEKKINDIYYKYNLLKDDMIKLKEENKKK